MTKDEIAAALEEIGTLLELKGESSFRTLAYHNGARALSQYEGDFQELVSTGKIGEIRGVGASLAEKIQQLAETGELPQLTELRAAIPPGVIAMLKIPGVGPKKVKALSEDLKLTTIDELKAACEAGTVAKLKGFGAKTQAKILEGIQFLGTVGQRVRLDLALPLGEALLEQLKKLPGVIRAELCGSLRRRRETTKDIDILLSSDNPKPIMDAFVTLPEVMQVVANGETKSSIVAAMVVDREKIVLNADLRVVGDEHFPFALHYFTGSKDHNVRLRQRAIDQGLSLNEYGLKGEGRDVKCKTEADIFAALGLDYIPPELREDTGEIEAAEKKKLPKLITVKNLRGVFHNHSTYSDGNASLEEMALAAKKLGFEYFGIGDHSQSLKIAGGLSPADVKKQHREIDELNARLDGIQILKGIESDILDDGSLDYDDDILRSFDYVVASVHTGFNMSSEEMTARICKALAHQATTMLGHATGRLLLRREGYKVDLDQVLKAAAKHGKMIEINAHPIRLDLDWIHVKRAKAMGIPIVINPDAHSPGELALVEFGIDVARRGWLEADNVFNTKSLAEVLKELNRRKAAW
ncbi:DNA polymerase/3'-5' exonuclease PolX [Zavarzinella formosa]|uniref:DNA polymerase/3'-5' exonuclease PolX n=1 Tax=Zavarzinella formosa TaxID=360055 RepID=UPI00031545A9|nr:DNA polymerase/3'-5' exonuclease PolX [Zavarzinella formosa]